MLKVGVSAGVMVALPGVEPLDSNGELSSDSSSSLPLPATGVQLSGASIVLFAPAVRNVR